MCRLCTENHEDLVGLTRLNCSHCPLLTSIPPELVQLTRLNCFHCPLLTSIPPELVRLTGLECSHCPLLTYIPPTLVHLYYLDCRLCTYLYLTKKQKRLVEHRHKNLSGHGGLKIHSDFVRTFKKEYYKFVLLKYTQVHNVPYILEEIIDYIQL